LANSCAPDGDRSAVIGSALGAGRMLGAAEGAG